MPLPPFLTADRAPLGHVIYGSGLRAGLWGSVVDATLFGVGIHLSQSYLITNPLKQAMKFMAYSSFEESYMAYMC